MTRKSRARPPCQGPHSPSQHPKRALLPETRMKPVLLLASPALRLHPKVPSQGSLSTRFLPLSAGAESGIYRLRAAVSGAGFSCPPLGTEIKYSQHFRDAKRKMSLYGMPNLCAHYSLPRKDIRTHISTCDSTGFTHSFPHPQKSVFGRRKDPSISTQYLADSVAFYRPFDGPFFLFSDIPTKLN